MLPNKEFTPNKAGFAEAQVRRMLTNLLFLHLSSSLVELRQDNQFLHLNSSVTDLLQDSLSYRLHNVRLLNLHRELTYLLNKRLVPLDFRVRAQWGHLLRQ